MQAMQHWIESSSRRTWGFILALAALAALFGAALMQAMGLESSSVKPLTFVAVVVILKAAAFLFWPIMMRHGRERTTELMPASAGDAPRATGAGHDRPVRTTAKRSIALWDQNDPRVDVALFSGNVPTFVLNHEQNILDWNPAFGLVFGQCEGVKKGAHVSAWFEHLDNFRRVSKRQEKLYGEGILPIADRERATFVSPQYGRMVFTKLMTPIVDRRTGKILGWTVVLNLNSVTKRDEFLQALFDYIAKETKTIRHAATYDGVLGSFAGLRRLHKKHADATPAGRTLVVGAGTGALAVALARAGHRVTAVEGDTHLLRKLRDKAADAGQKVRLVRQEPAQLKDLPDERFDTVHLPLGGHALPEITETMKALEKALKPGGTLCFSAIADGGSVEAMLDAARAELVRAGRFEELEHQYNCVVEHQKALAATRPYQYLAVADLRGAILDAGLVIEHEERGLVDGHAVLLVARKA